MGLCVRISEVCHVYVSLNTYVSMKGCMDRIGVCMHT